ncbi:MAG: AsmA family protein, partial [Gammaproteobacteria bacterium]
LVLENVVGRVNAADGVIGIDPSSADVYGGRYEGAVQLDVRGDVPKLSVAQSLGAVQTGGMLADLYGTENLQGLLQARIDGSGSGRTAGELLQDLSGSVALDLDDAVYKGADLWYEIRRTVARIKGKPLPAAPTDPQTQITALGFAGRLADGALQSERLVAEIPFIRVEGGGVFDLLQNRLDYRLKARMLSRPNFPDADDLADLERVTIPVTVTGDAADPKIGIDLESLAKDAAVQKVQDRLLKKLGLDQPDDAANTGNDATDQGDDARESLKKGLRDLFRP